ncbi:chorismate mutase [Erythrobacter sp. QSSC1-22B]|uniref:chorismate mutase n=1 Tax=Erythrobacter sp. QSSC1-22B TaxID=1860125 RepID=UPI000804BA8C|nr:chorismate mutase [Erythrobacter sp. QSSC1-22B]OBX18645.1 chorismate mutase [Erythrobacter sp. QSSC1-22B]
MSDGNPKQDATANLAAPREDAVLAGYRKSIDNIDAALVHILAERFRITQAVGAYKATATLPPADPAREKEQIARLRRLAEESDLDPEFSEKFIRFIIDEVIRHHETARLGGEPVRPPAGDPGDVA